MHGRLQRQADDVAVRQQEEQEGELDQEGEEEEPGQLGHLWEQRPSVVCGDPLCPRTSLRWPLCWPQHPGTECRVGPGCGRTLSSPALEPHSAAWGGIQQDNQGVPFVPCPRDSLLGQLQEEQPVTGAQVPGIQHSRSSLQGQPAPSTGGLRPGQRDGTYLLLQVPHVAQVEAGALGQ